MPGNVVILIPFCTFIRFNLLFSSPFLWCLVCCYFIIRTIHSDDTKEGKKKGLQKKFYKEIEIIS